MVSWMKNTLINTWRYRPIRDPLYRFGSEVCDSAENTNWTFKEAYRQGAKAIRAGDIGIKEALKIINSFTDEECRKHFDNKPKTQLIEEYHQHRRAFYIWLVMLAGLIHYQLTTGASTTFAAMVCGALAISLFTVLLPLLSWRCWQGRVGGNYPPHRFLAALLRNPLQIFP